MLANNTTIGAVKIDLSSLKELSVTAEEYRKIQQGGPDQIRVGQQPGVSFNRCLGIHDGQDVQEYIMTIRGLR